MHCPSSARPHAASRRQESRVPDDRFGGSEAITFVATVTIEPEHEAEYVALVTAMAEKIQVNEPGTTLHVLHRHPTEPHTYVAVERYRDTDAVTAHAESPYSAKRWGSSKTGWRNRSSFSSCIRSCRADKESKTRVRELNHPLRSADRGSPNSASPVRWSSAWPRLAQTQWQYGPRDPRRRDGREGRATCQPERAAECAG